MIKRPEPKSPLKAKRLKFIDEYMIDFNGTQAAIRAGYSAHCADVLAAELLRSTRVAEEIAKRKEEYKKKYEIKREYIIDNLYELIKESKNDKDRNTLLKSLDMLNKMSGNYVQVNVTHVVNEQPLFPNTIEIKPIEDEQEGIQ